MIDKPREWWIQPQKAPTATAYLDPNLSANVDLVHVIEYSLYESAMEGMAEYAKLLRDTELELRQALKERDDARAQLQMTNSNWPHEKKAIDALNIERARSAKLMQALRSWEAAKYDGVEVAERNLLRALAEYDKDTGMHNL